MMHTAEMMKAVAPYRGEAILIPGRSGRYWITLSDNQPLDVELGDPAWHWRAQTRRSCCSIPRATS